MLDELEVVDGAGENDHPRPPSYHMDNWKTLRVGVMSDLRQFLEAEVSRQIGKKGRPPRVDLKRNVEAMVSSALANLVYLHQFHCRYEPDARLAVQMAVAERSIYDRKESFRKLSPTIHVLAGLGMVEVVDHKWRQLRTTIRATGELLDAIMSPAVRLSDIVRVSGRQRIVLTAHPAQSWAYGKSVSNIITDYKDTEETRSLRAEMDRFNAFLSRHSITLKGEAGPAFDLYRTFTIRSQEHPHTFDLHGRLYGGFWLALPKVERDYLELDGEPIADLDFTAMFPSLAYIRAGHPPPEGDPYALRGLEEHRDGAKAALSALLSSRNPFHSLTPDLRKVLPDGWTIGRLRRAVIDLHPLIADSLEQDLSLEFMFTESRILLATLSDLMAHDVPALPIHDGIMVPQSKADMALESMERASRTICGMTIRAVRKV
jgi:hypothetical protein